MDLGLQIHNKNRNPKSIGRNKDQYTRDNLYANFGAKQTTLPFSAQICPKMNLGLEIEKTNVGIRISILNIPCVPIFRQNRQL